MNTAIRLNRFFGFCSVSAAAVIAGTVYGCSSSNNNSSNTSDAGSGSDASGSHLDSGMPGPDAAPDSGGSGMVLQKVTVTKLVADTADAGAQHADPTLLNPWGLTFAPNGTAWISENHSDLLAIYPPGVFPPPTGVTVVPPGDAGAGPSGQVFNSDSKAMDGGVGSFAGDLFIASTESGTIAAWQQSAGTAAVNRVNNSSTNAVYKGLAILPSTPPVLAAADFHNGKIDLFDSSYSPVTVGAGKWKDASIPTGYAPFNIVTIGNAVYVAYAKQDNPADAMDDAKGPGNGAISVFGMDGTFMKSLIATGGALNSPWGMAAVPTGGFGSLPAGTLLVGNFGDGAINAFDPTTGAHLGAMANTNGLPILIDGLWSLIFGVSTSDAGVTPQQLYFTAGPAGETHGLFGFLTAQ